MARCPLSQPRAFPAHASTFSESQCHFGPPLLRHLEQLLMLRFTAAWTYSRSCLPAYALRNSSKLSSAVPCAPMKHSPLAAVQNSTLATNMLTHDLLLTCLSDSLASCPARSILLDETFHRLCLRLHATPRIHISKTFVVVRIFLQIYLAGLSVLSN